VEKDSASSGGSHRPAATTHREESMGKTGIAISAIALVGLAIGLFVLLRRRGNRAA
jgi:hypothetical protein